MARIYSLKPSFLWLKLILFFSKREFHEDLNYPNADHHQPSPPPSTFQEKPSAESVAMPDDLEAAPAAVAPQPADLPGGLNPIAQIFRDQDLGRLIMGFLVPLTAILVTPFAPVSLLVRNLVFLSLSIGFAAIWNGILFRETLPRRYASIIEQAGAAFVILAVFALFSSFLPAYLQWISWACFLVTLLPLFWSCYLGT